MTLKVNRDALIRTAAGWDAVGQEFWTARSDMATGDGRGSQFGFLANSAGIDTQHNTFVTSMMDALEQGHKAMKDIAQALRDTATDFGATDTTVGDTFHNPDGTPR
jgi:hypothetical protein